VCHHYKNRSKAVTDGIEDEAVTRAKNARKERVSIVKVIEGLTAGMHGRFDLLPEKRYILDSLNFFPG